MRVPAKMDAPSRYRKLHTYGGLPGHKAPRREQRRLCRVSPGILNDNNVPVSPRLPKVTSYPEPSLQTADLQYPVSFSNPLQTVRPQRGRPPHRRTGFGAVASGLALALVGTLAGCAGTIPEPIRNTGATTPVDVSQVQADPSRHIGQRVRWGGTIIAVINRERATQIEVLAQALDRDGEPRSGSSAQGRFIAEIAGFVDPAEYPKDRKLTVVGVLTGVETRAVGEYPYVYPVVAAEARYLWPEPQLAPAYPYPGPWFGPWYDPWWGPWYGPPGFRGAPWYW